MGFEFWLRPLQGEPSRGGGGGGGGGPPGFTPGCSQPVTEHGGRARKAYSCPYGTPPPLHLHITLVAPCHNILNQVRACMRVCVCVCVTLASHRVHFCNMLLSKSLLVQVSLTFRKLCRNKPFEAGDYLLESGA